jgi:exopolysaccharide biosynthesis polyprenyl glycosylphosphotransferase
MFADELRKQKALFAAADGLAVFGAFVAALGLHDPSDAIHHRLLQEGPALDTLGAIVIAVLWLLVFRSNDLYRMRNGGYKELGAIIYACSVATVLTVVGCFLIHVRFSRITVVTAYLLSVPFIAAGRTMMRLVVNRVYANQKIAIPLVIMGFNPVAHYLCDQVLDQLGPYEPIGFIDQGPGGRQYRGLPVFPSIALLKDFARLFPALEAAVALPDANRDQMERIVDACDRLRINWWIVPWMLRSLATGLRVDQLGVVPLIGKRSSNLEGLNLAVKRTFDVAAGAILLILAAPLIGLAALAIMLDDGRPIFFRQTRVGAHGRPFEMVKLRTMRRGAADEAHRDYVRSWIGNGANGSNGGRAACALPRDGVFKLTGDGRVTRVGALLRRYSLDELPQLANVVRGEMSLIGPRPALPYEIELYQKWHCDRLDAPPGITGLWQVSGRNRLSFEEMVRLDVQYIRDWSLLGDLKILARTVPVLLRGGGA